MVAYDFTSASCFRQLSAPYWGTTDIHESQQPLVRQIGEDLVLNSYLGVPLLVGQTMVGTLELISGCKRAFDPHAQRLLETVAPHAAIAIQNAEQVIERERHLKTQIEHLQIEIDERKRKRQVSKITETTFFQELQEKSRQMRKRARRSSSRGEE
jgi:GAF domain-containing protein